MPLDPDVKAFLDTVEAMHLANAEDENDIRAAPILAEDGVAVE